MTEVSTHSSPNRRGLLILGLALIALIAAIAIPNIKLARITANEAAARRSLRAINLAETKYAQSNPAQGYTCNLQLLSESQLIDHSLANGKDKGFLFDISDCGTRAPYKTYHAFAAPLMKNQTGNWVFCSDQMGHVKGSPTSRDECSIELKGD